MHDKRFDPARAARLDDEKRSRELPLAALFERLGDLKGQRWAELGAGTGFATLPLATAVGPAGRVWAVDVEPRMVKLLRARLRREQRFNVETVCAPAEQLPLSDASLDGVLGVICWHELDDRGAALAECRRLLRGSGRLVLVDWLHRDDTGADLPGSGPSNAHRLRLAAVADELTGAGFNVELRRDCFFAHYVAIGHKV
ncbi:MAG: class I SAM-dependent methyltransferase [Deltaproteobacteria bacterium]|nr:class I SAM-dependent methyltransferase [Deltaproteobacteria bacterium]